MTRVDAVIMTSLRHSTVTIIILLCLFSDYTDHSSSHRQWCNIGANVQLREVCLQASNPSHVELFIFIFYSLEPEFAIAVFSFK